MVELGQCAIDGCDQEAAVTRKGDDKPLCWAHVMEAARNGELSVTVKGPPKIHYDPAALRRAIDGCDENVEIFKQGIKEQKKRKTELWALLEDNG